MLEKISPHEGVLLLREWGIHEWPDEVPGAEYWLFSFSAGDGCGVFAVHNNDEGGIDGHMAMRRDARWLSRQMCREFIDKWGHLPIRVPIDISRKHVKNVVLKMGGFIESEPQEVVLIDGTISTVFFLRRGKHG